MESKKVSISNNKTIVVNELVWIDVFSEETRKLREVKGYQHVMLQMATGMSDEEIKTLSMKDGAKLFKAYMELNEDTEDFQKPQENDEND